MPSKPEPIEDDEEEIFDVEITTEAHATASLGTTVIVGGKTAWPKFEFGDKALPGETAADLIKRVNDVALNGAFDMANQARALMQQVNTNTKEQ